MDENKNAPQEAVRAEPDRVSSRIVLGFGIVLVILTFVAMALMAALFRGIDKSAQKKDAATVAEAGLQTREGKIPPAPRLLVYEPRHWKSFRDAEVERLSTYGWMDRSTGAVHVPIERAMDLIAVRGVGPLPVAPIALPALEATPAAIKGVVKPTAPVEKKK
jgi:hypothetical protein